MTKILAVLAFISVNITCFVSGYRTHQVYAIKSAPRYPSAEAKAVDHLFHGVMELYDAGATEVYLFNTHLGYRMNGNLHVVYFEFEKQDKL